MKRLITCFALIVFTLNLFAQVGIGTIVPNPSAVLDITATDKGILIPQVSLGDVTDTMLDGVNTAATGLLIYNTNATVTGGTGVGYYYFNGTDWEKLVTSLTASVDIDWYEEGTTNPPNDITDDMYTQGQVAIGKTTADWPLDIQSSLGGRGMFVLMDGAVNTATYGLLSEVTNSSDATMVGLFGRLLGGGDGEQRGVHTLLNGGGSGDHYGTYTQLQGTGTGTMYGSASFNSNSGNGVHYGTYNSLTGSGNGTHRGTYNLLSSSGSGTQTGFYSNMTGSGSGEIRGFVASMGGTNSGIHRGFYVNNANDGDSDHFGGFNILQGDGNGAHYGVYNQLVGGGTNVHYGVRSDLNGSGTGPQVGKRNIIGNTGSGDHWGVYSTLGGNGTGIQYGVQNLMNNSSDASHWGLHNLFSGAGTGSHTGMFSGFSAGAGNLTGAWTEFSGTVGNGNLIAAYNNYTAGGNGILAGLYTEIQASVAGTGSQYSTYFTNLSTGGGTHYGNYNSLGGSGAGAQYGTYNTIANSGVGDKYGNYNYIDSTVGGTHYGIYSDVQKAGSYSGYFVGDMLGSNRLELTNAALDATPTTGSGILELGGSMRLDANEIITNTDTPLYLQHSNNGDLRIDNTTFMVDASANSVGIGNITPAYTLDVNGPVMLRDGAVPVAAAGYSGIYSRAGELNAIDAAGNSTVISPHHFSLVEPSEEMAWSFYSKNESLGKEVNVDMMKAMRLLEKLSGQQLVYLAKLDGSMIPSEMYRDNSMNTLDTLSKENKSLKEQLQQQQKELEKIKQLIQQLVKE